MKALLIIFGVLMVNWNIWSLPCWVIGLGFVVALATEVCSPEKKMFKGEE